MLKNALSQMSCINMPDNTQSRQQCTHCHCRHPVKHTATALQMGHQLHGDCSPQCFNNACKRELIKLCGVYAMHTCHQSSHVPPKDPHHQAVSSSAPSCSMPPCGRHCPNLHSTPACVTHFWLQLTKLIATGKKQDCKAAYYVGCKGIVLIARTVCVQSKISQKGQGS